MATYQKRILSGSTSGRGIKVAATATAGTLIHTAVAGAIDIDETFLYAWNSHTLTVKLTLEWGGVTAPDDNISLNIEPNSGLYLDAPGLPLQGGLVIRAFASVANVIVVFGYVNRITQ